MLAGAFEDEHLIDAANYQRGPEGENVQELTH